MGRHRRAFAEWVRRRERTWQFTTRLGTACLLAVLLSLTAIDRGTPTHVLAILLIVELILVIAVAGGLLAFCKTERG